MRQFYSLPKELLNQHLPLSYLVLYTELKIMERNNTVVTTPRILSQRLDIEDYTIRRMLKKLEQCGFISLNTTNKFTKITLSAPSEPWVKIPHEVTLTNAWRKERWYKEVFLYFMLCCDRSAIKDLSEHVLLDLGMELSKLITILDDFTAEDILLYEHENGVLTVQLLLHNDYTTIKERSSHCDAAANELSIKCKTTVTPIYELDLEQDQNNQDQIVTLADDLIKIFAEKKIKKRFSSQMTYKILHNSGLTAQQIKSGITEYRNTHWIDGIYDPESFCKYLLAQEDKRLKAELEEIEAQRTREEQRQSWRRSQEQKANDPAYIAKIFLQGAAIGSFKQKHGLSILRNCLSERRISSQEYEHILAEYNIVESTL